MWMTVVVVVVPFSFFSASSLWMTLVVPYWVFFVCFLCVLARFLSFFFSILLIHRCLGAWLSLHHWDRVVGSENWKKSNEMSWAENNRTRWDELKTIGWGDMSWKKSDEVVWDELKTIGWDDLIIAEKAVYVLLLSQESKRQNYYWMELAAMGAGIASKGLPQKWPGGSQKWIAFR